VLKIDLEVAIDVASNSMRLHDSGSRMRAHMYLKCIFAIHKLVIYEIIS
jgi:hypothetical protein